jgi:pimeloyl-ACP methyl ester carboxylesterase
MDLPREDPGAGPREYAETVAAALSDVAGPVVLVGHSMGGITIPNVAALRPVSGLVYLCAIVPLPARSWDETRLAGAVTWAEFEAAVESLPDGSTQPRPEMIASLYQASPPELGRLAWERCGRQTYGITQKPSLDFPPTAATYILCRDDRAIFPEWSRRTAREQLGVEPVELEGDHSPFLGRPAELADLLVKLTA